jgi:hypothetical protein
VSEDKPIEANAVGRGESEQEDAPEQASVKDSLLDKIRAHILEPVVVVAVVRSSSAVEADVDDADLMDYYLEHPETDREELLLGA